jgi:hypothetical protein
MNSLSRLQTLQDDINRDGLAAILDRPIARDKLMEEIRRREGEAKLGISVLGNGGSGLRVSSVLTNFSPFPRRPYPDLTPHLQQQKTVHAARSPAICQPMLPLFGE